MASFIISTNVTTAQVLDGGQTGFVTQNGSISVPYGTAITTTGVNDLLINGTVSSNIVAIKSSGPSLGLVVGPQGSILGSFDGLVVNVTNSSDIVNNGTIIGAESTGVDFSREKQFAAHSLFNTGTIWGGLWGVEIVPHRLSSMIVNTGEIVGGTVGIRGTGTTDAVLEIRNTGVISGDGASFLGTFDDGGNTSSDRVFNAGLMQGDVSLFSGDDLYFGVGGVVAGTVFGGAGNDTLIGGDGADTLIGNSNSPFDVDPRDRDFIRGGGGDDMIAGDFGNDTLFGGSGDDEVRGGGGRDLMSGGGGDDALFGGDGIDRSHGDNGNDTLSGDADKDWLFGGNGNDELTGGLGADRSTGGGGADTFIYTAVEHSPAAGGFDLIFDFTPGEDRIDLSSMVGPTLQFIGTGDFSGTPGEVRYVAGAGGNASVYADTDGDGVADLRIFLFDVQVLEQDDFLL